MIYSRRMVKMLNNPAKLILIITMVMIGLLSCSDDPVSPVTTGTINGLVIDADAGKPIALVSITTNPGTVAITTDSSGSYCIDDVPEGSYTIRASKVGYKSASVSVTVKAEKTTKADIILEKEPSDNYAPLPASNPTPTHGATDLPISLILSWSGADPDEQDSLTYDIYLGDEDSPVSIIVSNLSDTSFSVTNLNYETIYNWQIVTRDQNGAVSYGPIWSFSTEPFPQNRIVFTSNQDGNYKIYSSSLEGDLILQLSENQYKNWWPRLSPNRDKIAFSSDKDIEPFIYVMNANGTMEKKITPIPIAGYHNYGIGFCWSPDGTQLLFSHFDQLYRINSDGSNLVQIATAPSGRNFRECDWSPLGDKIVVLTISSWVYDAEIYLMNSDGTNMTLLMGNSLGATASPAFSPDGKKILFTHDVSGHEVSSGRQLDSHIFMLYIDASDTIDVSINKPDGTNDLFPRWSPDGAKIIFCNGSNDDTTPNDTTPKEIFVMDTNGSNRKKLIDNGIMPDWR